MDAYRSLAAKYEIKLIEDCCEGLGGSHAGRPIGGYGHIGVFGFYPNKQITTGEGGMLVTRDEALAKRARVMRLHGMNRDAFDRLVEALRSRAFHVAHGLVGSREDALELSQEAFLKTYRARAFERLGLHFRSELFARFGATSPSA